MGLTISAGRILITDEDGTKRFDTNEDCFHILTKRAGSRAFPVRQIECNFNQSQDAIFENNVYNIGSVDPACTAVFGSIKLDYASGGIAGAAQGLSENAWFSVSGGGTYVHVFDGFREGGPVVRDGSPQQIVTYTFMIAGSGSGRHIRLTERVNMSMRDVKDPGELTAYTVLGFTMSWRLRAGTFT